MVNEKQYIRYLMGVSKQMAEEGLGEILKRKILRAKRDVKLWSVMIAT